MSFSRANGATKNLLRNKGGSGEGELVARIATDSSESSDTGTLWQCPPLAACEDLQTVMKVGVCVAVCDLV